MFYQDIHFPLKQHLLRTFNTFLLQLNLFVSMNLLNAILLSQSTQYILVSNILTDITLLLLFYLIFCSNMSAKLIHHINQRKHFLKLSFNCCIKCKSSSITCSINMERFSVSSKVAILVTV